MMFTMRATKTHPSAQPLGFFDVELRVQWLEAKGKPLSRLAEWVETTDGAGYAGSAYHRPFQRRAERKQSPEVQASCAHRTHRWLHEPIDERILHALQWAAAQCDGNWLDQPDLRPGLLRIPIPNRDCREPPPEKRRLKPETNENQATPKDQTSGKHKRKESL